MKKNLTSYLYFFIIIAIVILTGISLAAASKLFIQVQEGKAYTQSIKMGLIQFNTIPQISIWLEDENGKFVTNIFVTGKSAKSKWGVPGVSRPSALPVWSHSRGILYPTKFYMPDSKHPLPDAETGASPKKSFTKEWTIPANLTPGKYWIKAEVNNSFDYNDTYKKDLPSDNPFYNDVNGQPSIVYKGEIVFGSEKSSVKLTPAGHGHPLGKDGAISVDMTGITSALNILDSIEADYMP